MRLFALLLTLWVALAPPAQAQDLDLGYVPAPGPGESPALLITPRKALQTLLVEVEAGGEVYRFDKQNLPAGQQVRLAWRRDTSVTEATAHIVATYPDGYVDELSVPVEYTYAGQLSVDLSAASADVEEKTITVEVSGPVNRAEIIAYGARRAVLDRSTVPLSAGPGAVSVPWVGDPGEVVLLDVKLHSDSAWAGFTYSPWFLDIPHDDVLFASNSDTIPPEEEHKLEATLRDLQDVVEKYGEIVPVKLYIAGCTDTVGAASPNQDLSLRRARAIASWLRSHGYSLEIHYYGFGERFLAVPTGDGVDEARNRRVLYLVGANPPPPSTGVPQVGWKRL